MKIKNYHIFNKPFTQLLGLSFNKEFIHTNKVYIFPQETEKKTTIHTFLMKYNIRIITLDTNHRVIENKIIQPLKIYKPSYAYKYLLESRTGFLKDIKPNTIIEWKN